MSAFTKLARAVRRWARDRDATAALEFALIAPTMLFVLFGAVEITNALQTNRRVENVATSMADVVSRDDSVSDAELNDLWNAIEPLMWPSPEAGMQARISSILIISPSEARVIWSEGHGGYAPRPENSTVNLPSAMMTPGSSVIMGEVIYPYEPALGFVFGPGGLHTLLDPSSESRGGYDIEHATVRRSRLVDPVPRE